MKAKQMFKKLGYKRTCKNDDYITYSKVVSNGQNKKEITFCTELENFNIHYEVQNDEQTPSINMELFSAISEQLRELGWI